MFLCPVATLGFAGSTEDFETLHEPMFTIDVFIDRMNSLTQH